MGDKDSGYAGFLLDLPDLFPGLEAEPGVQIRERLVQEQDPGIFYKSPGDGHTLLLSAGKFSWPAVHQIFDLYQTGGFVYTFFQFFLRKFILSFQVFQGKLDVLPHIQMGIKSIILKYHAHAPQLRGKICHVFLAEKDPAAGRLFKTADQI